MSVKVVTGVILYRQRQCGTRYQFLVIECCIILYVYWSNNRIFIPRNNGISFNILCKMIIAWLWYPKGNFVITKPIGLEKFMVIATCFPGIQPMIIIKSRNNIQSVECLLCKWLIRYQMTRNYTETDSTILFFQFSQYVTYVLYTNELLQSSGAI